MMEGKKYAFNRRMGTPEGIDGALRTRYPARRQSTYAPRQGVKQALNARFERRSSVKQIAQMCAASSPKPCAAMLKEKYIGREQRGSEHETNGGYLSGAVACGWFSGLRRACGGIRPSGDCGAGLEVGGRRRPTAAPNRSRSPRRALLGHVVIADARLERMRREDGYPVKPQYKRPQRRAMIRCFVKPNTKSFFRAANKRIYPSR